MLGTGRIGTMHARLLARRCGRRRARRRLRRNPAAPPPSAPISAVGSRPSLDEALAIEADAVAICTSTDTHVDVMIAAARQAGPSSARSRSRSILAQVDRGLGAVDAAGVPLQIGFNRRFDPSHKAVADAVAHGAGGRRAHLQHHEPRPGPAADRVHQGVGRDLLRHDDPRLRHGPLRHRERGRRGLRHAARCASTPRSARPATSTPPWCCSPTRTARSPRSTTAARRSTATTSGSRCSARPAWRARHNHPRVQRDPRHRSGLPQSCRCSTSSSIATPRATSRNGQAFVDVGEHQHAAPGDRCRWAGAAGDRHGRQTKPGREPSRARRGTFMTIARSWR